MRDGSARYRGYVHSVCYPIAPDESRGARPRTPPDFARLCRTVWFSTRLAKRPWGFPYGRPKPCSAPFATCTLCMALLGGALPLRIMSRREPRNQVLDRALSFSEAMGNMEWAGLQAQRMGGLLTSASKNHS